MCDQYDVELARILRDELPKYLAQWSLFDNATPFGKADVELAKSHLLDFLGASTYSAAWFCAVRPFWPFWRQEFCVAWRLGRQGQQCPFRERAVR